MTRYFLEVAYKGTKYSGFQIQENALTVQAEVEKAFQTLHRRSVQFTGSSRTDAGVHAYQNFFHFDYDDAIHPQAVYKLNAILPDDIVVKNIFAMPDGAHSRFDATSREYVYKIHRFKNPFLRETSFYYPYKLNLDALQEATAFIKHQINFFAFSKTNTQVKNFQCQIYRSEWKIKGESLFYTIEANRFLRGMVRLVTATLLKAGREKISLSEFNNLFVNERKCGFSVPAHGLYLKKVTYPENYFSASAQRFTDI
ncbi:tRNA pseudouridine(38-40) synthase TruA [Flavisolibacter ginsenosidimutans]|uniref:tRNA pseudouridine synthase A n=1 Tax=Flavisolibacter ginsenosidimutans TaxID=661481 RepID=A0A5B8UPB1_9BACT|nr:tRNA pseudouridine(38-40) synthase TruA [Flavisolibacter ginsenosidimutans]QEC58192.1 tRNA pseudouridine(38-40) synthase TruA [Flavisolibacter ginsenosidimutans]